MNVTIKEDCKSVLLDNGIAPPMLMDIEAFIQMAVEARNDFSLRNADLEAQLAQAKADNAAKDEALHWVIDFMSREADKYPSGSILWHCSQHIRKTCGEALRTHPGADLLRELEQYKASDASKEQYIAEIYSRAREAERELATHKKALEIACNAFKKPQEYYIELTKEALADGSIRE